MAKKKTAPKKEKSFEESLWDTANKLRGSVESSEYCRAGQGRSRACRTRSVSNAMRFNKVVLSMVIPKFHFHDLKCAGRANPIGEGEIRQKLVENDLDDCMIALPGQLFYTTPIPVCLWFLTKDKKADKTSKLNRFEKIAA